MDAGQVRSVLGLWRQHGDAFQRWHAAGAPLLAAARTASSQGGSPPSGLPPGEDSGLLLEVAAANADVAALQQRLEGLQLYSQQLARHVSSGEARVHERRCPYSFPVHYFPSPRLLLRENTITLFPSPPCSLTT
jgi:hypothetical protein